MSERYKYMLKHRPLYNRVFCQFIGFYNRTSSVLGSYHFGNVDLCLSEKALVCRLNTKYVTLHVTQNVRLWTYMYEIILISVPNGKNWAFVQPKFMSTNTRSKILSLVVMEWTQIYLCQPPFLLSNFPLYLRIK